MLKSVFWEKQEKYFKMSSAGFTFVAVSLRLSGLSVFVILMCSFLYGYISCN